MSRRRRRRNEPIPTPKQQKLQRRIDRRFELALERRNAQRRALWARIVKEMEKKERERRRCTCGICPRCGSLIYHTPER